ncbi:MAG TPA: rhodanese-like domain-containing protein [Telluria sp.]|nr:rhodanese-like domain-containing protein [Telluria sp.]
MFALLMGLKTVSPAELLRQVRGQAVTVVDVNSPQRWEAARVPGAVNLDPHTYTADRLPADHAAPLVFYCSNPLCRKAPQAARRAKAMGYDNVRVMAAGISGWLDAGMPVESGTAAVTSG